MTASTVTGRTPAGQVPAQSTRATRVRGRSATPARKIRTAALTRQERPVRMTGMCVRMTPVTERGPVCILITRHPVMTASTVTVRTPAAAVPVRYTRETPVREERSVTVPARRRATPVLITSGTACTDDGNVCTDDTCDGAGACAHPANTAPCDDGLYCNGADTCSGGTCTVHAGDPCAGGAECNSSCQEATDTCFDTSGTACTDDGNVCTDDTCDGAGACAHPTNTAPCDDGLYCNGADTCSGGACSVHAGDPCAGGAECNILPGGDRQLL